MMEAAGRSVTGAIWREVQPDPSHVEGLVSGVGMPLAAAIMAAIRGLTRDDIATWIEPKIRDLMPDPSSMTDMDKMVTRLAKAVHNNEKIGIFGDYDVDGASSAAILHDILTPLGCSGHGSYPRSLSGRLWSEPSGLAQA